MAARVIDRDRGWKRLRRELDRSKSGRHVRVGIQGSEALERHAGSDYTNAQVASVHEFGSADGHMPERSFIRATIDDNAKEIKALGKQLWMGVIDGKLSVTQSLEILGQKVVAMVRKRIRSRIAPPLDPATVARKGSSVPLIDTGQLVQSITYEVK